MKIRILDNRAMFVDYPNGSIVEVKHEVLKSVDDGYKFNFEWEDKYFEIVKEGSTTACDDQFNADPNMTIDTMLSEIKSLQEQRKNIDDKIEQYRQEITKRLQECGIDWESGVGDQITIGSEWKCLDDNLEYFTKGDVYEVTLIRKDYVELNDDDDDGYDFSFNHLKSCFKRIK